MLISDNILMAFSVCLMLYCRIILYCLFSAKIDNSNSFFQTEECSSEAHIKYKEHIYRHSSSCVVIKINKIWKNIKSLKCKEIIFYLIRSKAWRTKRHMTRFNCTHKTRLWWWRKKNFLPKKTELLIFFVTFASPSTLPTN